MEIEDLSDLTHNNENASMQLNHLYSALNVFRREAVKAQRAAACAQAAATIAMGQMEQAMSDFMSFAGDLSEKVAIEPNWLPPLVNNEGHIILETPYTERNNRIAVRAAHHQMSKQAEEANGDFDIDLPASN